MSILIPGKMPPNCEDCPCAYYTEGVHHDYCQAVGYDSKLPDEGRPAWCPIIELPPHGRLIDAGKLGKSVQAQTEIMRKWGIAELTEIADLLEKGILQEVENADTIIPADQVKEDT